MIASQLVDALTEPRLESLRAFGLFKAFAPSQTPLFESTLRNNLERKARKRT